MTTLEESARTSIPAPFARYVPPALEDVNVPAYVLDRQGRICWLNAAARAVTGDAVGRMFESVLRPDEVPGARAIFRRNLTGAPHEDLSLDLVSADGTETRVQVSSAALGPHGHCVGMFGIAVVRAPGERTAPRHDPRLTRRQREVLAMLADGASTEQIAAHLHLSRETVRNHIRHILQRLDARSRLEAVAIARRDGAV